MDALPPLGTLNSSEWLPECASLDSAAGAPVAAVSQPAAMKGPEPGVSKLPSAKPLVVAALAAPASVRAAMAAVVFRVSMLSSPWF